MRRLVLVAGIVMLMAVLATGVALAVDRDCNDVPCKGTDNEDILHERNGTVNDRILAYGDHDIIDMNNFSRDRDVGKGDGGPDKLLANDRDGRDVLRGGKGRDRCYGDPGDRFVSCNVKSTRVAAFKDVR